MTGDERDAHGEGASSDEREPVPEVQAGAGDPADRAVGDPDGLDVDREFARIVAAWSAQDGPAEPVGRWPAAEDLDDPADRPSSDPRDGGPQDRASAPGRRVLRDPEDDTLGLPERPIWRGPTGSSDAEGPAAAVGETDDDDRYVPPDPPPLGGDAFSRLAWVAVLGGPLFLVLAAVFWQDLPRLFLLAALGAFVGGFVALVARMPRERGEDDDGAVV